jgi:hypothetical protein
VKLPGIAEALTAAGFVLLIAVLTVWVLVLNGVWHLPPLS